MNEKSLISFENLSIGYGQQTLVKGIHLSLPKGSVMGVLGRNGSGKSTLLRTILGLLPPIEGDILMDQQTIHSFSHNQRAAKISAVLQERPNAALTVSEVLHLGRLPYQNMIGKPSPKDQEIIESTIDQLNLRSWVQKKMSQLSDGERQKVMIGRALIQDTPIVILDEPTVFLDVINAVEIFKMIKSYPTEKKTWIFSTHQLEMALQVCSHLLILDQDNYHFGTTSEIKSQRILELVYQKDGIYLDGRTGRVEI